MLHLVSLSSDNYDWHVLQDQQNYYTKFCLHAHWLRYNHLEHILENKCFHTSVYIFLFKLHVKCYVFRFSIPFILRQTLSLNSFYRIRYAEAYGYGKGDGFAYMVYTSRIIPIMYVANKLTQVGNSVLRIRESINVIT